MHKVFVLVLWAIPFLGIAQYPKLKAWEVEADTLMNHQNFAEAIKLYTKVITTSKLQIQQDYRAVYKRAVAYYSIKEFQKSLQDLDQFVPQYPQVPQGHILRALIYRELGDTEKQLTNVEAAAELQGDPSLIKWRATLLMDKGSYELAKRDLLFVRQVQPDPEAETQLGFAYYSLQQRDSALVCLNKAIELEPTYIPAYYYAGSFCLQDEAYDLGLKYLNVGLRLEPTNSSLLFYKGIALIELKKQDEGCRFLRKAFEAGEDDASDYLIEYCYKQEGER